MDFSGIVACASNINWCTTIVPMCIISYWSSPIFITRTASHCAFLNSIVEPMAVLHPSLEVNAKDLYKVSALALEVLLE